MVLLPEDSSASVRFEIGFSRLMVPVARVRECCYLLVLWIVGVLAGAANDAGGVAVEEQTRGDVSVLGYRNLSVLGVGARFCSDNFDALGDMAGGDISADVSDVEVMLHGVWSFKRAGTAVMGIVISDSQL